MIVKLYHSVSLSVCTQKYNLITAKAFIFCRCIVTTPSKCMISVPHSPLYKHKYTPYK